MSEAIRPTKSQLRCLLRPAQTGNGAEVRAVTALILSKTDDARKTLSNFAVDPGYTLRRITLAGSLTTAASRSLRENPRGPPDFIGHLHLWRNKFRSKPGVETNQVVGHENLAVAIVA